jgi:methionyl-tRNA formyltransferase
MRLVFAGTSQAAVCSLAALLESRHEVAAVITRPDAPAGRGRPVRPSPVGRHAAAAGLPVLKPASPRDLGFLAELAALRPDCCPVTAYGALLPQAALEIPPHGWVNLHFSLLPAWRGAAPVAHAIWHGDDITGASTFAIVAELDAGPVYGMVTEPIGPCDTAGDLLERLARSGARLLVDTLDGIEAGRLQPVPQRADGVSYAPKLTPRDARVRWDLPALAVSRQIRACTPAPGAWTMAGQTRLKVWPVRVPGQSCQPAAPAPPACPGVTPGPAALPGVAEPPVPAAGQGPGEVRVSRGEVLVGTGSAPVALGDVQPAGKRRMSAAEWARGQRLGGPGQAVLVLR